MKLLLSFIWYFAAASICVAQNSPARVMPGKTGLSADNYEITLSLALSHPVPYRIFILDNPRRFGIDFQEIDFSFLPSNLADDIDQVSAVRFGLFKPKQSRLILDLEAPFIVESAEYIENVLKITLHRSDATTFTALSLQQGNAATPVVAPMIEGVAGLPLVALDAGHGGIDPGAVRNDVTEKQVTLLFARQLRDALLATGRYRVLMIRNDDSFLALPERIRLARASSADIFISLHANTVERGNARGTTVYNLSEDASNDEAASRAEQENRSDIIAGAVLLGQDDEIANILLALAQRQTNAGSVRFADTLASTIRFALGEGVPSRRMAANFRVLRAVDTPSVLVELGFMSNTTDLANLLSPSWRGAANQAIIAALDEWLIFTE